MLGHHYTRQLLARTNPTHDLQDHPYVSHTVRSPGKHTPHVDVALLDLPPPRAIEPPSALTPPRLAPTNPWSVRLLSSPITIAGPLVGPPHTRPAVSAIAVSAGDSCSAVGSASLGATAPRAPHDRPHVEERLQLRSQHQQHLRATRRRKLLHPCAASATS